MPAAYCEISGSQGADLVNTFKIVKPGGGLYKFLPIAEEATPQNNWDSINNNGDANKNLFWYNLAETNSSKWMFGLTIPEELKIIKPNAYSWLYTSDESQFASKANKTFLSIKSTIKDSKGFIILSGETVYKTKIVNGDILSYEEFVNIAGATGIDCTQIASFKFIPNNLQYNLVLNIPSSITTPCGSFPRTCQGAPGLPAPNRPKGTECFRGSFLYDIEVSYYPDDPPSPSNRPFIMRLLQGKLSFNPNITTI